jgi:CubicO group peptidase (beta-lactamase class C family)
MRSRLVALLYAGIGAIAWFALWPTATRPAAADFGPQVDSIFSPFTPTTPGCAVGVGVDGGQVLAKGYGTADLEHDIPIAADTIFEAGSVSKQFTAAAVLLLARDRKLSLEDPVRKYIPELPDFGAPLTIRHMLTHTSGLRDWGSVEAIAGWPRTTRAYTHAHVLDIVSRQRALNFTPGTHWSYSNTGFNLAAILVSRVAQMPFAEFTRTRMFEPLKMTDTSWRDDHTRVVKRRAVAYDEKRGEFHTNMPFEDVHGNGGLLTTVGDLLKWNEHFTSFEVGDARLVSEQERPVNFSGGSGHGYGLGLMIDQRRGVRQVEHSGSTAGYLAHLARYPDQRVSVAVLCNRSDAQATQRAYDVADLYLAGRATLAPPAAASYTLTADDFLRLEGLYRSLDGRFLRISRDGSTLRVSQALVSVGSERGLALIAQSGARLVTAGGQTWEFDGHGHARARDRYDVVDYERVPVAAPSPDDLKALAGTYVSEESETTLTIDVNGESLVVSRRPDVKIPLTPAYKDAFAAPELGVVIFRRDAAGRVSALSVAQDRVWDLRFTRQTGAGTR